MDREEDLILRRRLADAMKRARTTAAPCPTGVVHCNRDLFENLLKRCRVVVADFWAEWCGPCRMIEPVVEEITRRYAPKVAVAKINVDENSDLTIEYSVMSIPTLIVFNNGREVKRLVGYYPGLARDLIRTLEGLVSS